MMKSLEERFKVYCVNAGELLEKAQAVRGEVFFGVNVPDRDEFDKYCDHIVVVDCEHDSVVGTYRLLRATVAQKKIGFYSETEFDIATFKSHCCGELLEMGRACVKHAYRRHPVINLIWKKIVEYVSTYEIEHIFGCASVPFDPLVTTRIYNYFKERHFAPLCYRVYPLHPAPLEKGKDNDKMKTNVGRVLPSLIKGYLKMGAFVCGEPAFDEKFNTADFFMFINVAKMNATFKKRFE